MHDKGQKTFRILGWIALLAGVVGPFIRYADATHYMGMPNGYWQASWFISGGAFVVAGAWLAFRLKPWWLYLLGVLVLIGVYIGLVQHAEAEDHRGLMDFLLRSRFR
jgi:uncharacterized membrane protein